MSIGANVLSSEPVLSLRDMYMGEYASSASASRTSVAPAILNALGACAGFAAQIAVWRELVLPKSRNPGDFLVFVTAKSGELFYFGEAINQLLFLTAPDRLSFLSLAAGTLSSPSELPDIGELLRHVTQSIGSENFGRPRVPPSVDLPELPRAALARTWSNMAQVLKNCRPAEWPALLGAAAHTIVQANRTLLAPPLAVKIMLEAAAPMSKLNPTTLEGSGVPTPLFENWSMRAVRPENNQAIVAEVRAIMPTMPAAASTKPPVITQPRIAFLNLAGAPCAAIVAEDRAIIGELFGRNVQVATALVPCDVLFLYCSLEPTGKIVGQQASLRGLIRESAARVVVVASELPANFLSNREFQAAIAKGDNLPVNLVLTLNRNGDHFGHFFKSLFEMMWKGVSMPMAWVQLVPQGPVQPNDIPGTICLMEAGQIAFVPSRR
jgi:hypothetical protein